MKANNALSIAAVERETGLSKDTLRVWERRYRFPTPARDATGERFYAPEQVEKLRLIRRLIDQGHRPGKIVGADIDVLRDMVGEEQERATRSVEPGQEELQPFIDLCRSHETDALRREMSQALLRKGLFRFVVEVVAPLNVMVGTEWANGTMAVFEEHLYTECVQAVMRNAIASIPVSETPWPRVLLTTMPKEQHGLGLLMSEAILALEGAHCISLGTQTPVLEIGRAAHAQQADIVALSFSSSARPAEVLASLADLHAALPEQTEIWAGGGSAVLHRRPPPHVRVLELQQIRTALAEWRSTHGSAASDAPPR